MTMALDSLEKINASFDHSFLVLGNHDLFYRDRRDIASIELARNFKNITIIRKPTTIDGVTFLPWLVGDEHKKIGMPDSRYVFAHLEVPGFLMNAKVEMPESAHTVKTDIFEGNEAVFTGHFHMRQSKGNIHYTGNVMPFNFSDNWDGERGAMFLEWGAKPDYQSWDKQPLFRTMKLSELLTEPEKLLRPKMTARVSIDIDISYEEAQIIKETMVDTYGLRKIELVHQTKSSESDQTLDEQVTFQTVDQIVVEGLMSVQSQELRPEFLVEIYKGLNSA